MELAIGFVEKEVRWRVGPSALRGRGGKKNDLLDRCSNAVAMMKLGRICRYVVFLGFFFSWFIFGRSWLRFAEISQIVIVL